MKDEFLTVAECFTCDKNIKKGDMHLIWGEAYCSNDCLEQSIKSNMSDVIDQIAEVRIG